MNQIKTFEQWADENYITKDKLMRLFGEGVWNAAMEEAKKLQQPEAAPAVAQVPEAAEQVEFLGAQNHQLRRAIHAAMSRLSALLDEDQFAEMEQIFARAGVAAPEAPAQGDADSKRWRVRLICCGRDDGEVFFPTWEDADRFREQYTSGYAVEPQGYSAPEHASGHRRVGIVEDTWKAASEAPAQADACCGNWAAGTNCFADPKIDCPRLRSNN